MFGSFGSAKPSQATAGTHGNGPAVEQKRAHVIVIGNEKGGSGKTTTTMHLIVGLLRLGFTIGSIDIDSRQRSLTRYVENRVNLASREGVKMPVPTHVVVTRSPFNMQEEAEADERERFTRSITKLMNENDFVVIDSPGSDTYLSRFAHSFADTIITPINDSFVDLDVLATVDGNTLKIVRPSIYSEMVWEQKLLRARRDGGSIEWIVMRNRLSNIDARNKRFMGQVLAELSRRIGFRAAPGFSERVIFREMFLQGLTVLDVMDNGSNTSISLSHVAARQEVRDLLKMLRIPAIDERVMPQRVEQEDGVTPQAAEQLTHPTVPSTDAVSPARHAAPPVAQPIGGQAPAAPSSFGFAPPAPPISAETAPAAAPAPAKEIPAETSFPQDVAKAETAPEHFTQAAAPQTEEPRAEDMHAPQAGHKTFSMETASVETAHAEPLAEEEVHPARTEEAPAAEFSLSPAAFAAASATPVVSRDTSFLMSSSMLQQAASAIRSAARQALSPRSSASVQDGQEWTSEHDLPELAVKEEKEKDWEAAS